MSENPYPDHVTSGDHHAARHGCWAEGYAAGRADTLAVARDLADALREISHVKFASTYDMQVFARFALAAFDALADAGRGAK